MEPTLGKFEARFSDYTALFLVAQNARRRVDSKNKYAFPIIIGGPAPIDPVDPEYAENCDLTSEYLYQVFEKTFLLKTKSTLDVISYLEEEIVVYFEYLMTRGESHALCFIVDGDEVIVCQSLGGLYRATHERIPRARFIEVLLTFFQDNDPLTEFGHAPVESITKIRVALRKEASSDLIPSISPQEEAWLRKARLDYVQERWPDGQGPLPEEYRSIRQPDLYHFLIQLQATY